jgi:FkbM family methyltransferase
MTPSFKDRLRAALHRRGWFLRRTAGLPCGVELGIDWERAGLPPARCVLDVGAHRGETCRALLLQFPGATVHAFEPVAENFAALQAAMAGEPDVHLHPVALGSQPATVEIALQPDSQTHSLRHAADGASGRTEHLTVTTLDAFVAAHGIERIDLLKIDTEGFELEVIRGGDRTFGRGAVGTVLLEASLDPEDRVHTPLPAAAAALRAHGFELAGLHEQVLWPDPVRLAYFNAFFVRRRTP